MKLSHCVLLVAALALIPCAADGANLLTNGGFETGDKTGWSEVSNGGAVLSGGGPFVPIGSTEGIRFYGFETHGNAHFLYQTVAADENTDYLLRGMVGGDEGDDVLSVWLVDGAVVPDSGTYPTNGGVTNMTEMSHVWYPFSARHTTGAGVTQMTVIFRADHDPSSSFNWGRIFLDDLQLDTLANLSDTPVAGLIVDDMNGTYSAQDGTADAWWGYARGPWSAGDVSPINGSAAGGPAVDAAGMYATCDGTRNTVAGGIMTNSLLRDFVNLPAGTWTVSAYTGITSTLGANDRVVLSAEVNPSNTTPHTSLIDADDSQAFAILNNANQPATSTWVRVDNAAADYGEPVGPTITTNDGDTIRVWLRIETETAFPGVAWLDYVELSLDSDVDAWMLY